MEIEGEEMDNKGKKWTVRGRYGKFLIFYRLFTKDHQYLPQC
jgi:hypothetical protein